MKEYHGKKITDYSTFDEQNPNQVNTLSTPDGVYARVRFVGNFGFMCGEYQEFERYRISHLEAEQIAWSAFGLCGKTVTVFDEQGNLIDEWK